MHIPGDEALPVATGQVAVPMPPDEHGSRRSSCKNVEVFFVDHMHACATSLATGRISSHSSCSAVRPGMS
jgi:hypothetical protein